MMRSGSGSSAVSSRAANSSAPIALASSRPSRTSIARRRAASTISWRAAVIEGDRQRQPAIVPGQRLRPRRARRRCRARALSRSPMIRTRTPFWLSSARSLRMKRLSRPISIATSSGGRRPVFGGKAVDRQVAHAVLDRRADRAAHRLDAAPVALEARQAARLRPAAVAVHDDGDMRRRARRRRRDRIGAGRQGMRRPRTTGSTPRPA